MAISQYFYLGLAIILACVGMVILVGLCFWGLCAFYLCINEDYVYRYLRNRKYGNVNNFLDFILRFYYNFE